MIACPICRAVHRVNLLRGTRSGDLHRCTACGFVYADPRGRPDPTLPPAFTDQPAVYRANARHRLGLAAGAAGVTAGRLLDVGCYDGGFLLAARELGYAVQGVEPAPAGAARARERGLPVLESRFEDAAFAEPFAIVTFIHSLEHFADPLAALRRARELLRPGGAVVVEVPNFDAWSRRLLGRRWRQYLADHDKFFEPATLRHCLTRAGFEIRFLRPVGKVASIGLLADRLGRYYSAGLGRRLGETAGRRGWTEKTITLNLGDILLAVAIPSVKA